MHATRSRRVPARAKYRFETCKRRTGGRTRDLKLGSLAEWGTTSARIPAWILKIRASAVPMPRLGIVADYAIAADSGRAAISNAA
jgi:hypothetical protein